MPQIQPNAQANAESANPRLNHFTPSQRNKSQSNSDAYRHCEHGRVAAKKIAVSPYPFKSSAIDANCSNAGERSAIIYTIIESCRRLGIEPYTYLRDVLTLLRHLQGDEGALAQFPIAAKRCKMLAGAHRLSVFRTRKHLHFWIITEADGELTIVLMPEDL